jgi:peptidoglycan/LPS O-acetylase OafA/YrhL
VTKLNLFDYLTNRWTFDYLWTIALDMKLFLPGVFESNALAKAVNGSLWSIPAECLMYLLTPPILIAASFFTGKRVILCAITIVVSIASLWFWYFNHSTTQFVVLGTDLWVCLSVAPYFWIGACFAVCGFDRFLNIYVAFMGLFALSIFATGATLTEAMLMLVLPYACLSFGSGPNALHRHTRGIDISYGLFLWGFPVQQTLNHVFGTALGPWQMFFASLCITAPIALLSWTFVEKPMLRLKTSAAFRLDRPSLAPVMD